jgi:hypothetical protein
MLQLQKSRDICAMADRFTFYGTFCMILTVFSPSSLCDFMQNFFICLTPVIEDNGNLHAFRRHEWRMDGKSTFNRNPPVSKNVPNLALAIYYCPNLYGGLPVTTGNIDINFHNTSASPLRSFSSLECRSNRDKRTPLMDD